MTRLNRTIRSFPITGTLFGAALLFTEATTLYAGDLSATVSLTSDYVFRGVSYTDGPALQGSVDYAFDNGVYIGTWASSYDFDSPSSVEVDYYIGYSRELTEDISLSTSALRYTLLDEHNTDYNEFEIGLAYGQLDVKAWYAPDYGGTTADAEYYEVGFNSELPMELSLEIRAGRSSFDTQIGVNDYTDYIISISKSFGRIDADISVTDTNENQFGDREDLRVIFTVSTTFE